jgi:hypothetical protein
MKKILFGSLLVVNLFALDGNRFVEYKIEYEKPNDDKTINWYRVGAYQNYIAGVVDSVDGILFCTPANSNGRQIVAIVGKYIDNHPEEWNGCAFDLVYKPLSKAFPCKKKK